MELYGGIDLGVKSSAFCLVNSKGQVVTEDELPTEEYFFEQAFGGLDTRRVVVEACSLAEWACQLLEKLGHEAPRTRPPDHPDHRGTVLLQRVTGCQRYPRLPRDRKPLLAGWIAYSTNVYTPDSAQNIAIYRDHPHSRQYSGGHSQSAQKCSRYNSQVKCRGLGLPQVAGLVQRCPEQQRY